MKDPKTPQKRKYSTDKAPERAVTRRIVLPLNSEMYAVKMACQKQAKELIDQQFTAHPELFPEGMREGYKLHGRAIEKDGK